MALDIKQLRQKHHEAKTAAEAINAAASPTGFTAEQQTQFDAHLATMQSTSADMQRAQALLDVERTAPSASVGHDNALDKPFASLGEFLGCVRNVSVAVKSGKPVALTDQRVFASLGANETVDPDGGFLVMPEFASTLITRIYEEVDVISRCDIMPMESSRVIINGMVDNDRSSAATRFAGMQVYRMGEGQPYQPSKPKYRRIELNANKMGALFYATEELLADAPAIQNRVETLLSQAFPYQITDEIFAGTGEGQMLGVQTSNAQVVVPKTNGQATGTISVANILAMWEALWLPSRKNAVWFIQQDLEAQLYQLVLGSGVGVELMYTPVGMNGNNGPYALLMGRPVIPVEQCAALGVQGDICLWDLGEYIVGQRQGIRADSSIHVAFLTGEQAFRWMLRNDGQPKWDKPLIPRNSQQFRSPFVTLAARP